MSEMILYNGIQYYDGGILFLKNGIKVQILLDNNFKKIFVGIKENNEKKEFFELEKNINDYLDVISNSDRLYEGTTRKIFSTFGGVVVFSTIFFGSLLVLNTVSPYDSKTITTYSEKTNTSINETNLDNINLENMDEKNRKIVMEYLYYITNEYVERGITIPYIYSVEDVKIYELTAEEFRKETTKAVGFIKKSNRSIYLLNTDAITELCEEKLKRYGMTSEEYYERILKHEIFHAITNCGFTDAGSSLAEAINEKENYNFYGYEINRNTYKNYQRILEILSTIIPYDEIVQDLFNDDVDSLCEKMSSIYGNNLNAFKLLSMIDQDNSININDGKDSIVELNELDLEIVKEIIKYEKAFITKKMREDKSYTVESLNSDIVYFQNKNSEIFNFDEEYTKKLEKINIEFEKELYSNYSNILLIDKSAAIPLLYEKYNSKIFTDKKYGMSFMVNILTNSGEEIKDIFSQDYDTLIKEFNKIGVPANDVMKFLNFLDLYYNNNQPGGKKQEYASKILEMLNDFERKSFSYKIDNLYTSDFGLEIYLEEMAAIKKLNTIIFALSENKLSNLEEENLKLDRDMTYFFCNKKGYNFLELSRGEEYLDLKQDEVIDIRR